MTRPSERERGAGKGADRGAGRGGARDNSRGTEMRAQLRDWISRPLFDYHVLLAITALLTGIGLVMVLSSSMAQSGTEGSVWSVFIRQAAMVAVGLFMFWAVSRVRVETIRKLAPVGLLVAFVTLVLVLIPGIGIGLEETGAQSWIYVGGVSIQPSEVAKVALAVWGAKFLAERLRTATDVKQIFIPFGAVSTLILGLVFFQRDLGMVASMGFVVLALMWFAGIPRFIVGGIVAVGVAVVGIATLNTGFRSARISVYFNTLFGRFEETQGPAYQSYQGILSLADGSMTGVGLGQSRAKWFYLPEAKNDFIFAIIGEEAGFLGAVIVVLLYGALGWVGLRVAQRQADPFLRLMAGTITTATVVQAFINIGYVVGVLPVTGLQLPLISAGGTSAIVTLLSMGLLATCARHEPESVSAMQTSGRPAIDRILGLPEPLPYDPSRRDVRVPAGNRETRRFGPPVTGADDVVGDRGERRAGRREARPGTRPTRTGTGDRSDARTRRDDRGGRAGGSSRGVAERYRESERGDRRPRGRVTRRPGGPDRRNR
ncbi:putative lipid II flippase FtsW [Corynebacterium xerosis]|uniref:Probable peptidoglycan glycosyltransferase FtsW n=1 Tax=Corynebacterium xerosis TaxID=1725 RepID=A0A6B8TDX6_9CORY|nr:putative lipid II flippase FtsW [Corynebacterium xerosis]QGS33684.1 putative lipid II flippase FtsW [Corynebacterium xerosis]